jgi:S1-C subfamily serine protease
MQVIRIQASMIRSTVQELAPLVQKCGAGKVVNVVVIRIGKEKELDIKLGVHPEDRDPQEDD